MSARVCLVALERRAVAAATHERAGSGAAALARAAGPEEAPDQSGATNGEAQSREGREEGRATPRRERDDRGKTEGPRRSCFPARCTRRCSARAARVTARGAWPPKASMCWMARWRWTSRQRAAMSTPPHPEPSALLRLASGAGHAGGAIFAPGSAQHQLLSRWIADGAKRGGGAPAPCRGRVPWSPPFPMRRPTPAPAAPALPAAPSPAAAPMVAAPARSACPGSLMRPACTKA